MRSVLAAALGVALVPAAAQATTCTFTAATKTMRVTVTESAAVGRTAAGALTSGGAPCGAARVDNTDAIAIVPAATGWNRTATVDLGTGPLGPGATPEATGTSEIELSVALGGGDTELAVLGSPAADAIRFGTLGATLNRDADADLTYSGVKALVLRGRAGNDALGASGSAATGSPLAKPLGAYGGAGADVLAGGMAADVLAGDADAAGVAPTAAGNDNLTGGEGSDQLSGEGGDDKVSGEDGSDALFLGPGDDTLLGGSGGDSFRDADGAPGAEPDGADVIRGGSEADSLRLAGRTANLVITLDDAPGDGADTSVPPDGIADEGDDYGADLESVTAGRGNDAVSADSAPANAALAGNSLDGGAGNDVLTGGAGNDFLKGAEGRDQLLGGTEADRLFGDDGVDRLSGDAGDDQLDGGLGGDTVLGGSGPDDITEEAAADGRDSISGGPGVDYVMFGERTTDLRLTLDGVADDGADADGDGVAEEGDNVRADVEEISTGTGDDLISADFPAANLAGAANSFYSGPGDDTLLGGAGEDQLMADAGADRLTGGPGEDYLYASWGVDVLDAADGFFDRLDLGGEGEGDTVRKDAFDFVAS